MIPLCYTTVSFAKYRYLSGFIKTKIIYLGCSSATDCKETKNNNRFVFTNKCHNTVLWKRLESSASMLPVVAWGSDRLDVKRTFGSNKWLVLKTRWFIVAVPVQVQAALVPCEINRSCSWMSHLVISYLLRWNVVVTLVSQADLSLGSFCVNLCDIFVYK